MTSSLFRRLTVRAMLCTTISLVLSTILFSIPVQAHPITASLVHNTTPGHVTVMILDMSGSMAQNDPNGLRCSSANAYIDLSGPGDSIGVIGLDNNNAVSGGVHNFQLSQVWAEPREMATISNRQELQQTIIQKSNNCRPDGTTPTYDSLYQAVNMLTTATKGGQISGSVILLTDGLPDPDSNEQINAINSELLPLFKQHNWPIDTIALGPGTGTHLFLGDLSNATSGKFYDDSQGIVSGVSPLNIATFFVDIFALRDGRTPGPAISPTTLNGRITTLNFQVSNFVDSLNVIVIKDQPNTAVTLTIPNGQTSPSAFPGLSALSNPYYVIFSIDNPQAGPWQLHVNGSGEFLMESLIISSLSVAITSLATDSVLPLGQGITISATISNKGNIFTGKGFNVIGSIAYANDSAQFNRSFVLTGNASTGIYQAKVSVPENAPPGSYEITVSVNQVANIPLASASLTIRLQFFPQPFFLSPQTNQPTEQTVNYTVIQWDPILQYIYSLPVSLFQWLSSWPLQHNPSQPYAIIAGQVEVKGKPYSNAIITAMATHVGSNDTVPTTVVNDGKGRFQVLFMPLADGMYIVTFKTSGTFQDSHGDFGTSSRTVYIVIRHAMFTEEFFAWLVTSFYILCLAILFYLFQFWITPRPFGEWVCIEDGEIVARHNFGQARRNPISWFFRRNILSSQEAFMPPGLQLRFLRGNLIQVRADGTAGAYWRHRDGSEVQTQFQEVRELIYDQARYAEEDEGDRQATYIIISQINKRASYDDEEGDYGYVSGQKHRIRRSSSRGWDDYE